MEASNRWWRSLLAALGLGAAMLVMPWSQASADEVYTRTAKGIIDVAPDGTVDALAFEGNLGEARAGYEALVRRWRFNPIMTSEGEPVDRTVRVSMRVELYATRQEDGGFSMSTGRPVFEPLDDPDHMRRVIGVEHFPVPRYPERTLAGAHEARILLLVQAGPDGSVTRVGTRSAALLNSPARGGAAAALRPFIREARNAAGRMRFVPSDLPLREVIVPIQFSMNHEDEDAWSRIVFVPKAGDSWVAERYAQAARPPAEIDARGEPVDSRVSLLTEIEDPWL